VPHPPGRRTREETRVVAQRCVEDIVRLTCDADARRSPDTAGPAAAPSRALLVEAPDDAEELDRFFMDRQWGDGLPVVAPTAARVERMLRGTRRAADEVVANIAPSFAPATVELIAINAALAGCYPEHLPVLIAAVEAAVTPKFNGIRPTTHAAAVWLLISGPAAKKLGVNGGGNCFGQGNWANAALGRAIRLILQNVGALPGQLDYATQGQPGKYSFCCAENISSGTWEPLHVERGYTSERSTVTVVSASSPVIMSTHARDADDLIRVFAATMAYPACNDYVYGSEPWIVLCPEHAEILQRAGLGKAEVKRRLWDQSRLAASQLSAKDFERTQNARRTELGEITPDTLLPISVSADAINVIVAGGPGTHSAYIPVFANSRSVTREILE